MAEIFTGPAWRAESGLLFRARGTAQDIIDFEVREHGNVHIGEQARRAGVDLTRYPAKQLVWVTKTREDAERYGEPEPYHVPADSLIIATDPDGGYLILLADWQLHAESISMEDYNAIKDRFYEAGWWTEARPSKRYQGRFDLYIKRR